MVIILSIHTAKHRWFKIVEDIDFLETKKWPSVVLMPKEYKLRVGGMSLIELRQQLENYWGGGQGGILDDAVEGPRDTWVPVGVNRAWVQHKCAVFSHWVNRECDQWLSYFIAKNHTFGAVHAWFAAFLGVTRESRVNLAQSFTNRAQSQDLDSEAFMEPIHRIKTRMSFDVCIEGHDKVVDGLPSLPCNAVIVTNAQGMQVIHNSINNMFPWRIWDICANTVIPTTWFREWHKWPVSGTIILSCNLYHLVSKYIRSPYNYSVLISG